MSFNLYHEIIQTGTSEHKPPSPMGQGDISFGPSVITNLHSTYLQKSFKQRRSLTLHNVIELWFFGTFIDKFTLKRMEFSIYFSKRVIVPIINERHLINQNLFVASPERNMHSSLLAFQAD